MLGSHAGAVLIIASLAMPIVSRLVLAVGVMGSLWVQRRTLASATGRLRIESDGNCVLAGAGGVRRGRITGAAAYPLFVCLAVNGDGRRARTLLVMRDAVAPAEYRELRARIVQRRLPAPAGQSAG